MATARLSDGEKAALLPALHRGLSGRTKPENLYVTLRLLDPAIEAAIPANRGRGMQSYMQETFTEPSSLHRQMNVLQTLTGVPDPHYTEGEGRNPAKVHGAIARGLSYLKRAPDARSFRDDRMSRSERAEAGVELSKRQYNKLWRHVSRLQESLTELEEQQVLARLARFAKTGFAGDIAWDDFKRDRFAAAFIAYYTANRARRSLFTNGPQARAYDTVAARLYTLAKNQEAPNWWPMALAFPHLEILQALTEQQRYQLLGSALSVMETTATRLEAISEQAGVDTKNMVVQRGADSSTWNALAGSWNRARDYWLVTTVAMGAESMFEHFLPGKVMRLMAADVVRWHRMSGKDLDPDTRVFAKLPRPWDVMSGRRKCGLVLIERVLEREGIPTKGSSWLAPRANKENRWQPTPESVHGVVVNDPGLAQFLRRVGVFSGKRLKRMTPEEERRAAAGWEQHVIRY